MLRETPVLVRVHQQDYSISTFIQGCLLVTPTPHGFNRSCQLYVSGFSMVTKLAF